MKCSDSIDCNDLFAFLQMVGKRLKIYPLASCPSPQANCAFAEYRGLSVEEASLKLEQVSHESLQCLNEHHEICYSCQVENKGRKIEPVKREGDETS